MQFNQLFEDIDSLKLNYDFIQTINEFAVLAQTQQNEQYHKEGNVWNHTRLVTLAMKNLLDDQENSLVKYFGHDFRFCDDEKKLLMCAALCHDLGKAGHTTFDKKDGLWHCARHGFHGENITRRLFYDNISIVERENVCTLVRSHMVLHHILDSGKEDKIREKLIGLSWTSVDIRMFVTMYIADLLGSISSFDEENTWEFIVDRVLKILDYCREYSVDIWKPYNLDDHEYCRAFRFENVFPSVNNIDLTAACTPCPDRRPTLNVLVGLPGSGKDTWLKKEKIDERDDSVIICRDNVRIYLGMMTEETKCTGTRKQESRVTEICNKQFADVITEKKDIYLNNTNLHRKYREEAVVKALAAGYRIVYHVIESMSVEDCIIRRDGQIDSKVIERMWNDFEYPTLKECHLLYVHKQRLIDGEIGEYDVIIA